MAESSRFRKTVDLIKERAILSILFFLDYLLKTASLIAFILVAIIIGPSVFQIDNDIPDDVADFMFGLSAIFHMLVDPLFLYVPIINEETKCVMLDNRVKIAAIVLRSFGDVHYVLRIYGRIKRGLRESRRRQESHSLKRGSQNNDKEKTSRGDDRQNFPSLKEIAMRVAIDTVCILPVPQVVILIFLPKMRGSRSLKIMKFLNSLILLQYLPRLYPIFKMWKQGDKDILDLFKKKEIRESRFNNLVLKWFGIVLNILGYIFASHVLGAFWYFFSIQREIDCWEYACRIETGCGFSTSCVENTFKNITHMKNLCPVNPPDATVFDFGIFLYALQSGVQGSTNFFEKFLQCLSWGLRNLSSFASNLNSSTYGWENLFVVVICLSGLLLFMYLIGHNPETYMQEIDRLYRVERKMKMIIEPKIQLLLYEYCLQDDSGMKRKIKRAVELILEKDEDFILENMFSILSCNLHVLLKGCFLEGLDLEIKRMLFLDKLKKVEGLKDKDEDVLEKICEHFEHMIYTDGSYIIREGEPLDMMFFVTQGDVLTYVTNNERNIKVIEKEKYSLYGEELLTLAEWTSSKLSSLPISTVSVKSHKKVEVFALNVADLHKVVSEFPGHFNTSHMEIVSAQ